MSLSEYSYHDHPDAEDLVLPPPEDSPSRTRRAMALARNAMLCAALFLALFNSEDMRDDVFAMQKGPTAELLERVVVPWHETMEALGFAGLSQALRDWFQGLREGGGSAALPAGRALAQAEPFSPSVLRISTEMDTAGRPPAHLTRVVRRPPTSEASAPRSQPAP